MKNYTPTFEEFINERLSWKGKNGEYTFKEMFDFLSVIVSFMPYDKKSMFPPTINIPSDRISSSVISDSSKAKENLKKFNQEFKEENPKYYIWQYNFKEGQKVKRAKHQRVDLTSLFEIAEKNNGSLKSFSIGFTSDKQKEFATKMANDKSLD